jgi:site-specific DNA recombinase
MLLPSRHVSVNFLFMTNGRSAGSRWACPRRACPQFVLYLRKSKGRAGISRQRTVTTAHIERLGGTVVGEYVDVDRTAYRKVGGDRPAREGFDALLTRLGGAPGLGVGAWHADRLLRSADDTEILIAVCAEGSHSVETPSGGRYELDTASGRKRLRSDAVDAAFEVDHLTERVLAAKAETVAAGGDLGGRKPFGWQREDGQFILVPAEAELIRSGTRNIIAGGSLRGVTRAWNASGATTSGGNAWTPREVSRVLRRGRNAGLLEHHGEVAGLGNWPPIVTETDWRAVCAVLSDPRRRTSPGNERRWLLSGLATCGVCGRGLIATATSGKGRPERPVYRCRPEIGSGHVARDARTLDGWIREVTIARLSQPAFAPVFAAPAPDLAPLHAQAEAIRGELDDLARLVVEGTISARQMALSSGPLRERLARVEERIAAAAPPALLAPFAGATDVATVWDSLPLDRRREMLKRLMTVEVLPARRGRVPGWRPGQPYFDPGSVRITPADQL